MDFVDDTGNNILYLDSGSSWVVYGEIEYEVVGGQRCGTIKK